MNMKFGKKIRELRLLHNMSQGELAQKLGYTSNTAIYLIEKDLRGMRVEKLEKVARLFSVSMEFLTGDADQRVNENVDIVAVLRAKNFKQAEIEQIKNFIDFIRSESEVRSL